MWLPLLILMLTLLILLLVVIIIIIIINIVVEITHPSGANRSLPLLSCQCHVEQESCGFHWWPRLSVCGNTQEQFSHHMRCSVTDSWYVLDSDLSASVAHHSFSHTWSNKMQISNTQPIITAIYCCMHLINRQLSTVAFKSITVSSRIRTIVGKSDSPRVDSIGQSHRLMLLS